MQAEIVSAGAPASTKEIQTIAPSPVTEHTMEDLGRVLADGIAARQPRIVIPPGVYKGSCEPGKKVHITISNLADTEIVADGVTMLCTDLTRALTLDHCSRVTVSGLTVDYDPLPFTQGDIVAVNPQEGWLDVKIHAGYPLRAQARIDVVDRTTRFRKMGSPYMWESKAEIRPDGVIRVINKTASQFATVGDLASMGADLPNVVAHTIAIEDSASVTLSHVTVFSSNCMGIVASHGDGGHHFDHCRVVPGPPPPGATEGRILSTDADAILTGGLREGVLTENCEIRDAGDDSWSVQSSDYVILKRDGNTFIISSRDSMGVRVGDRLQSALGAPIGTVTSLVTLPRADAGLSPEILGKLTNAGRWGFWHLRASEDRGKVVRVTVRGDMPWKEGDSLYDIDAQGNGFVFRDNTVRSSGRILIKASGIVENNHLESPHGIMVNPEVPAGSAVGIESVVIRNNTLSGAHHFNAAASHPAGAISVTAAGPNHTLLPAGAFGRIVIEGNTISGGNGADVVVSSAREVSISKNRFMEPQQVLPSEQGANFGIDNHAIIWLAQCDKVVLSSNSITSPGSYLTQPLVLGPDVRKVVGELALPAAAAK
jgi:hypothetical protein